MVSMTPDYSKKVGLGVTPSPIPFLTPRPERRRTDSRGLDWTTSRQDKDREVNVQVLLRCRPLSDEEQRSNVPKVISCNELRREVTIVQNLANKHVDRVFAFDKVFGPKAQQRSIFDQAIVPIVKEVLEGFNCTVFAYGQTGAGKTYTMEGEMRNKGGDLPVEAGVIPRAVRQIFDTLEAQNADYSMRVTFLELYNEEITDLLAKEDYPRCSEDKPKKPISLMEDGKGSVIVRGLEEEVVYSANDIYNLLEHGAAKRRTADTLLNKRSSRSHSVFSITVHVKETVVGDEELIKCGKLNLVDLAGSENIYRSGAREGRAREAGEINKSLLTLGRVINALVEHSVHIPYRDSKLTRLLRDSLGGKTKTCIIATISPTALCLDETLSTLEYAYRAKSIKNKPEANQKISKAVLLKDLYLELERMKQDVRAARDKNGVYIPHERFAQDEAEKKERIERIDQMEIDLNLSAKQADKFRELYMTEQEQKLNIERELKNCKIDLDRCNTALLDLQEKHMLAITKLKEKELIISKLRHSENRLIERAKELCANLQNASEDISLLSAKIDQKNKMESENQSVVWMLGSQLDQRLKDLHKSILVSVSEQEQQLRFMEKHICSFLASKCDATKVLESRINQVMETYALRMEPLKELSYSLHNKVSSDQEHLKSIILLQTEAIENFLATAVSQAKEVLSDVKNSLNEQLQVLVFTAQKQEKGLERRLASVQEITKATTNFLNELHRHASTAMMILDNSEIEKSQYLATFENNFKEDVAKEEKLAMQKIAEILSMLTSKKTAIVSKATRSIHCSDEQVRKRLQQEMSSIQHVAGNANDKLSKHMEEVESYFLEDAFSSAESRTLMENFLQECFNRVSCSGKQWENAQSSINVLNKTTISQTESSVKESICRNQSVHEEFLLLSSSMGAELDARAGETLAAVNDSLILDHETRKELDSVSHSCLDQLKSIQENHGKGICDIQKKAEHCLQDDYLIDQHLMPQTRGIAVPSLASIEEMRTPLLEDLTEKTTSENKSKWGNVDKQLRQQLMTTSPNRTPLSSVN